MKQSHSERVLELLSIYPIIDTVFGIFIIIIAIILSTISAPTWIAVIIGIGGWWFIGSTYWRYEAWRASGQRGIYWNPSGGSSGVATTFVWLTFGVFISMAHSFCRSNYYYRLTKKWPLLKKSSAP